MKETDKNNKDVNKQASDKKEKDLNSRRSSVVEDRLVNMLTLRLTNRR
jgi:hypothetical protein